MSRAVGALRVAHPGTPRPSNGRLHRIARDAEREAEATEPADPPADLPQYRYKMPLVRRRELLDERIKTLEEQRFATELDWEVYRSQVDTMSAGTAATEDERSKVRDSERALRVRIASLDAVLGRLTRRKV